MSQPEVILWQAIRRKKLGYIIKRQQPFGPYFLDFYIGTLKLAIEVDGRLHELSPDYDGRRDAYLNSQGVAVVRIEAQSIYERLPDVVDLLRYKISEREKELGKAPSPSIDESDA
ncbi:MAG: DUF559 domain-containing protein [Armatimonadetes bacterium]|nr:DUF559 domain-containing protein [Armatimonadota bacterium]